MEIKSIPICGEKIQHKKSLSENLDKNYTSLHNQNLGQNNLKEKKQNKLELNKENFQIIQQKGPINEINNNKSFLENKKDESSNIINNLNVKNIKNDENINIIKKDENINLIKEDEHNYNYNYIYNNSSENNYNNVYTLLNSYYKDVNLNFKNDIDNNNNIIGKNFLHKNKFQESSNNYIISNNLQYSYPYNNSYMDNNINNVINNQNCFSSYINNNQIQDSFYPFPNNAFSINNQNAFYSINYFNNNNNLSYNFNFNNNKNKYKYYKKSKDNNNEYKLFIINLDNILKGIDTRTTIMIRHIPNKYSYQNLLEEINTVCKDKYDFFYLPLDSENYCNLGYAFINFINPLHIIYFYNIFKSRKWLHFNSFKECDLTFAKYQGKYELTSNIEKKLGKNDDKRRMPMIFEIKNPPKIDLFRQYYDIIKEYRPELLNDINWI